MTKNPFGDDTPETSRRVSPFRDDPDADPTEEAASRVEHAARKIRALRTQMGAEGLTLAATRELIGELSAALDATAKALRSRQGS